jgi:hypothetical protein
VPFESHAQQRWAHTKKGTEALGGAAKVAEWDSATKGKKIPEKIKSYESGGTVTETGLALVHKGEQVIPRGENMEGGSLKELMAAHLGSGEKKKKAKLHMNIHKLDDGKFMVEHSYRGNEPTPESTQHAPANLKELHAHLDEHYGPEESESPAEAAAEPQNV